MRTFTELYNKITDLIKREGKLIVRSRSDYGADIYELKGVKAAFTDVGYGSQLYSDSFHFWADYHADPIGYRSGTCNPIKIVDFVQNSRLLSLVLKFLEKESSQSWNDTLPDSFWLEKFIEDCPINHTDDYSAVKYDFTKLWQL